MHPDLVKLLDLQEKDLALVEVDSRLAGILGEIEQLDKELADAERNLESRRRSAAEALRKRQESETKIENYRRLLERQQARTDQLRGQREIQAAMTEMDLARSVLAKEENDWVQAGDSVIAQDAATRAAEEKLQEQRAYDRGLVSKVVVKVSRAHPQRLGHVIGRDGGGSVLIEEPQSSLQNPLFRGPSHAAVGLSPRQDGAARANTLKAFRAATDPWPPC